MDQNNMNPQPQYQPQPQQNPVPYGHPGYAEPWQAAPAYYPYQQPVYVPQEPVPTPAPAPGAKPAPSATPVETKKKGGFWKTVLISSVVAAICCSITAVGVSLFWQSRSNALTASFDEKMEVLREEMDKNSHVGSGDSVSGSPGATVEGGLTPAQVYAKNVDSVVAIECIITEEYYGQLMEGMTSGSGFVLTSDGYIVSNYHVVEGATSITVILNDSTQYDATYVGGDPANDIALLKVEATNLKNVKLGSSDALIVGDQVAAIGNPLGELASTLTVGYISAKDRIVTTDGTQINMLQTDAAINPGNSGGPLFNMKGEVIGITSAKYSGLTESGATIEGIGFAIPMDDVTGMLDDLRIYGYITGAYLGVSVSNVDADIAQMYGVPLGALVRAVSSGSCAQKAGIQARDIITNLGGHKIENLNDLTRALRRFEAGDTVSVTVYRGGNQVQLSITLDEKPQQD
jgi:serine protease Do